MIRISIDGFQKNIMLSAIVGYMLINCFPFIFDEKRVSVFCRKTICTQILTNDIVYYFCLAKACFFILSVIRRLKPTAMI